MSHLITPELIFYAGSTLLEGPCWDEQSQVIYCVSIEQSLIYRFEPSTGNVKSFATNGHVGCAVIDTDGMLLSAEKGGIYRINPDSGARSFIGQFEEKEYMRYNDGKLDPVGRFLVGTKGYHQDFPGEGKLFSYDGSSLKPIVHNTTISNGIGFNEAHDKMYFIDTPTKKVGRYSYDIKSGTAEFDQYVVEIEGEGWPDGLCVDIDDNIWVAEWEGSRVCKWNPETGKKLSEIQLPCSRVTSCCLGGKEKDHLYITTAKDDGNAEPLAGGLFRVRLR
jgi:sugar lactone lactonase YvrE